MKIIQGYIEVDSDYIRRRGIYWKRLRAVRQDKPDMSIKEFLEFMKETYGVRVIMNNSGITPEHEILDEAKFMFLLLKYE